jgi:hypothetical protein
VGCGRAFGPGFEPGPPAQLSRRSTSELPRVVADNPIASAHALSASLALRLLPIDPLVEHADVPRQRPWMPTFHALPLEPIRSELLLSLAAFLDAEVVALFSHAPLDERACCEDRSPLWGLPLPDSRPGVDSNHHHLSENRRFSGPSQSNYLSRPRG